MSQHPRKIGKYTIKSLLGEGATSIVYEAFDPDIVRRVAIKSLRSNLISGKTGDELLARFRREAISAARCLHPNVVTILEYGQRENIPYIVMEYVDGVTVHSLIKHRLKYGRGISLRRTLSIISQLLAALNAAHKLNIVHRDIKASNVMIVNGSGRIKLADFGMARITDHSDLTLIGSLIGTPRYMAPELRLGLEADARADIFSAARLFLELLRLLPATSPFPRSHLPEIANMPPGNRIDYTVTYPTALIPVLAKGLHADRLLRYQTVQEFMQAIKQALPGLKSRPVPVAQNEEPAESEPIQGAPVSEDELESMETLLADFIGPAATMIMEEHETDSTSAYNLALEIAQEIPEQEMQKEFLRRWGLMSESRRALINEQRTVPEAGKKNGAEAAQNGNMLHRIGNEVVHFFEPITGSLLRNQSAKSTERKKSAGSEQEKPDSRNISELL